MSNIVVTTLDEAQVAIRDLDDRLTAVGNQTTTAVGSLRTRMTAVEQGQTDLQTKLSAARDKILPLVRAVKYLAQLHLPPGNGARISRGAGHVRADETAMRISEMSEE